MVVYSTHEYNIDSVSKVIWLVNVRGSVVILYYNLVYYTDYDILVSSVDCFPFYNKRWYHIGSGSICSTCTFRIMDICHYDLFVLLFLPSYIVGCCCRDHYHMYISSSFTFIVIILFTNHLIIISLIGFSVYVFSLFWGVMFSLYNILLILNDQLYLNFFHIQETYTTS